ncbi:uncharacterized protein LOC133320794, partial [Danaus plexippus]|uniref:uncharacterized protein LOC133320794 n=1 Tax=Danaus plexippus TaxID=13037 RepID=UPI002AAF4940
LNLAISKSNDVFITGLREFDNGRKRYCLGGYTFYKHKPILRGDASRWLCTRRQCPVYLHLDSDLNLLYRPSREHPHPPVCIYRNASGLIEFGNGRTRYYLNGYTYYKIGYIHKGIAMRWQCTRRACPVYIHLDEEMNLIHPPSREHRHPTIRLHRTAVGTYVKI